MAKTRIVTDALLPGATPAQSQAVLGAMRAVAETGGPASDADRAALTAADLYLFGHPGPFVWAALAPLSAGGLAAALAGTELAEQAVKFLTVMALMDGRPDAGRVKAVSAYADALGIAGGHLDELAEVATGSLQAALADMSRANAGSVTGQPADGAGIDGWLRPYGGGADPALARRFRTLEQLDPITLGHAFWAHFTANGYAFPGEPGALNAAFAIPHDSTHVLTGYDTTPRGEVLVSTFTAAMHPTNPMAGHILPVVFSWQMKAEINRIAGSASHALDPAAFSRAWAAGAAMKVDAFAPGWDFWGEVVAPVRTLRERYGISRDGVEGGG